MDSKVKVNHNSLKEYQMRINKVLDYIENNLGAELSLETLSNVACFSSYHFHRIFSSIVGETVGTYVKKRRLAAAANRLKFSNNTKISEVAYEFGFSGQSDFSRSFKAFFNVSPSEFTKRKSLYNKFYETTDIYIDEFLPGEKEINASFETEIQVKNLEDHRVAYIRSIGLSKDHRSSDIEATFSRLFIWAEARGLINRDTLVMGITLDNPEILPFGECRHDACITVSEEVYPDGCIGVRTLFSNGKYVTFEFNACDVNFSKSFFEVVAYLYGTWIPRNGYLPDDRPCIEIYRRNKDTNDTYLELCVPIKPF